MLVAGCVGCRNFRVPMVVGTSEFLYLVTVYISKISPNSRLPPDELIPAMVDRALVMTSFLEPVASTHIGVFARGVVRHCAPCEKVMRSWVQVLYAFFDIGTVHT